MGSMDDGFSTHSNDLNSDFRPEDTGPARLIHVQDADGKTRSIYSDVVCYTPAQPSTLKQVFKAVAILAGAAAVIYGLQKLDDVTSSAPQKAAPAARP